MCLSFEVLAALGREVQNHMSESRGFNSSGPRCREAREDSKASAEAATFDSARTEGVRRDRLCVVVAGVSPSSSASSYRQVCRGHNRRL